MSEFGDDGYMQELLLKLGTPFQAPELKKRKGAWNKDLQRYEYYDYIEWNSVVHRLNDAYPRWAGEVKKTEYLYEDAKVMAIAVTYAITINGVTREGIGTQLIPRYKFYPQNNQPLTPEQKALEGKLKDMTDMDIKGAESDALKRAAIKFGVGLHIQDNKGESSSQPSIVQTENKNSYANNKNTSTSNSKPPLNAQQVQSPTPVTIWEDYVIHRGRNKGKKLGLLTPTELIWYIEKWQLPERPSAQDKQMRDWLDSIEFEGGEV